MVGSRLLGGSRRRDRSGLDVRLAGVGYGPAVLAAQRSLVHAHANDGHRGTSADAHGVTERGPPAVPDSRIAPHPRGVDIEVLIRNNEIWTAYPTNLGRNP